MKYVVITGTVVDGLQFHGPFTDINYATDYADYIRRDGEWHTAELVEPEQIEGE